MAARQPASRILIGLLLGVLFVGVNAAFLRVFGITRPGMAPYYLDAAREIADGRWPAVRPGLWLAYPALIAVCQQAGLGLSGVVALQLAAAAGAAVALYRLAARLAGPTAGILAAALLILNPAIAQRHGAIVTDSLYTSFVIFSALAIHRARDRRPASVWRYLAASAIVIVAALMRPNGWMLPPIAVAYWTAPALESPRQVRLAFIGIAAAFVVLLLALPDVRRGIEWEDPEAGLRSGEVVAAFDGWTMEMPDDPAGGYAIRHPVATAALGTARIAAEMVRVRPYYSARHNAALAIFLGTLYAAAVAGLVKLRRQPLAKLLATIIAAHLLPIALTEADWDGRFLQFVLPVIGVFAAWTAVGRPCGMMPALDTTSCP